MRAQAEAQVDHVGYGIEGGELEKGDQQQGGKKIQVGPDARRPLPIGVHLPRQLLPRLGLMPDQTEASPKGNQPAGEPLGGVGEEHHAQHPGGENEHHRPAIEQQQPLAGSHARPHRGQQQERGDGIAQSDHLITYGDEHHIEGAVGRGYAVFGHVIDLCGLPSRRGGGDGADIEPGKGVTQAPAVGEVVPQTGQDELRAHGLTAHKAEHQPQAQQHIAGPDGREDAQQAGEGLLPEKKEDRSGHEGQNEKKPPVGFPVHHAHTPLPWAARVATMRARLCASSRPFRRRIFCPMRRRALSS